MKNKIKFIVKNMKKKSKLIAGQVAKNYGFYIKTMISDIGDIKATFNIHNYMYY